jgi:uncharacterized membrane protein
LNRRLRGYARDVVNPWIAAFLRLLLGGWWGLAYGLLDGNWSGRLWIGAVIFGVFISAITLLGSRAIELRPMQRSDRVRAAVSVVVLVGVVAAAAIRGAPPGWLLVGAVGAVANIGAALYARTRARTPA